MAIEIERKFLLASEDWKAISDGGTTIKQGYLNSNPERTTRVRVKGKQGFLTVKGKSEGTKRLEFEYEIPLEDAVEMLDLCEKPIIEKIRYEVALNGNVWEIDAFDGENKGLVVAEVELEDENQKVILPDWIGEEVSHERKYFNSALIKNPFLTW